MKVQQGTVHIKKDCFYFIPVNHKSLYNAVRYKTAILALKPDLLQTLCSKHCFNKLSFIKHRTFMLSPKNFIPIKNEIVMSDLKDFFIPLKQIVVAAGEAILQVYHSDEPIAVESKSDDSPVTKADHAAHIIIDKGLKSLATHYPVLSEEGGMPEFEERRQWQRYWLVDPLDGTKEFINKNDEFTVNIALIEGGEAILGMVYVPVTGALYYGAKSAGAWKELEGETQKIQVSPVTFKQKLTVVGSRRHGAEALEAMLKNVEPKFESIELVSMGSSLKICAIAEGTAHWYPRLALTSEWDTAAAHAVLNAAGGKIMNIELEALDYNQKADILNPYFHAVGDSHFDWEAMIRESA